MEVGGACVHPVLWHHSEPVEVAKNVFVAAFDAPADDVWRAFYMEFKFDGPGVFPFIFTTQVQIVPFTYPFPNCHGEGCRGKLV